MVYNYDKMNCSNEYINKNYLFDFSKFFRFYNIFKHYYNADEETLLNLLLNPYLEIYKYDSIDLEHYNAVYEFMKEDIVNNIEEINKVIEKAREFIKKFNSLNTIIDKKLKVLIDEKIRKTYLRNETKYYLLAATWLRGALCNIKTKFGPERVNCIINFVTDYYSQKNDNNFKTDLVIYEEGLLYRIIKDNSYYYVFEFYINKEYEYIDLSVNNKVYKLYKVDNKYISDYINDLKIEEMSNIGIVVNHSQLTLINVDLTSKV
jgi:hypothetical protein